MSQASIIQVFGTTAGIVVGWQGNVRFVSAQSAFDALDGRIFRSVAHAQRAAAAAISPPPRPLAPAASSQDIIS
jgi:hypothetical protein